MLAAWGVDYIKIDGMKDSNADDVKAWSDAIRQSGRPMVLDVTQGNATSAIAPTLMKYANQWEFAPDVECYRCEKGGSSYPLTSWAELPNASTTWRSGSPMLAQALSTTMTPSR